MRAAGSARAEHQLSVADAVVVIEVPSREPDGTHRPGATPAMPEARPRAPAAVAMQPPRLRALLQRTSPGTDQPGRFRSPHRRWRSTQPPVQRSRALNGHRSSDPPNSRAQTTPRTERACSHRGRRGRGIDDPTAGRDCSVIRARSDDDQVEPHRTRHRVPDDEGVIGAIGGGGVIRHAGGLDRRQRTARLVVLRDRRGTTR